MPPRGQGHAPADADPHQRRGHRQWHCTLTAVGQGGARAHDAARLAATLSALLRGLAQQSALGLPPDDLDTWVRAARGVTAGLLP
ncbi:TetR family transcriptional regulator C-terminal domain-containing protein [Streptomyces sp. NBC_00690]|uniref:TetR family transcriptional regulator C-terminal domain-containing protein n=1 Tax=Streptomyces sp. NBC_00690 TaxID=2975808 RepID=UPI002E2BBB66|nr:TetR family transcriptional regulator C-terminal domain-containing protein [Streptomyces sp. NBC_00690]